MNKSNSNNQSQTQKEKEYRQLTDNARNAVVFIQKVLTGKKTKENFNILLPNWVKQKVKLAVGFEINSHKISKNGIIHAKKGHGIGGTKVTPQSPALTDADFELFPYILQNPDYIEKGTINKGKQSIRYVRLLPDGKIVYVESEAHNSNEDFVTKTAWKEKSTG
ncbi:MAG: hypothetical protein FWC39_07390 [Bacteroidetes bacterium]|nr:hypothetical protein [Bacteroidota bacterium]